MDDALGVGGFRGVGEPDAQFQKLLRLEGSPCEPVLEGLTLDAKLLRGLAGRQGLEPRFHGPEPCVLPLDDRPIR